jgi:hypothetical protein
MRSLGRAVAAAAGLLMLLAPSAAFGSWWDGGYPDDGWGGPVPPGVSGPLYGCENSTLADTGLGLVKTTTPPPGTPVRPGDEIIVEITWRVWDWMGPDLHKAIDCVYINGLFAPELSGGEKPTPNDGHFAFHYFVPPVPPGSTICDQGFVSGPNGYEDYARQVSNVVCFPVDAPPPPPPPPPCCEPAPPPCCEQQPPPPCDCVPETTTTTMAPTTTTTTVREDEAEPYTESARFEQEETPPAPPAAEVLPRDVLPRTGADGGAATRLAAGALGLAMLSRRIRRR